jgi:hypothetical protein
LANIAWLELKTPASFAGTVAEREGQEVVLKNARRNLALVWRGNPSQLATNGTSKPEKCKFPAPVDAVMLFEVIEIIPISDTAAKSIESVPEWKQ